MKKSRLLILAAAMIVSVIVLTGCGNNESQKDSLKAECYNGTMLGQEEDGVISFLGVPYAQQPVGNLRWKAPAAAEASDEEIECYEFGHTACQYEWPTEPASYYEKGEDCLTLNVWKSSKETDEPKAVMFWIHGGGNAWGGTTDPIYNGHNLVEEYPDVIFVTANYRLGLFAWPDFSDVPGGEEYTDINLGTRDLICALEWVQQNIEAFGGDPDNVTIMGQSAGSINATAILGSPKAEGLFSKVIAESCIASFETRQSAKEFAEYIMDVSGYSNMDELLAVSAEEWMALDEEEGIGDVSCNLVVDGDVILDEEGREEVIARNASNGVILMNGTVSHDENYFQEDMAGDTKEEKFENWHERVNADWNEYYDKAENRQAMDEFYELVGKTVDEEYASDEEVKDALIKSDFRTNILRKSHIDFSEKFSEDGTVYMYYWDVPSTKENYYKSACHAVELSYVLNNPEEDIYSGEVDATTAAKAQEAWVNFAKTGNPSIDGTEWGKYDIKDRNTMMIDLDRWYMESDPLSRIREIMNEVNAQWGNSH